MYEDANTSTENNFYRERTFRAFEIFRMSNLIYNIQCETPECARVFDRRIQKSFDGRRRKIWGDWGRRRSSGAQPGDHGARAMDWEPELREHLKTHQTWEHGFLQKGSSCPLYRMQSTTVPQLLLGFDLFEARSPQQRQLWKNHLRPLAPVPPQQ